MTMRLPWCSLVMSTVFLLVTLQLLRVDGGGPFELPVTLALAGAALLAWVLSLILPAAIRRRQIRAAGYPTREQPVPSGEGDYRSAPAVRRVFADQAASEITREETCTRRGCRASVQRNCRLARC